MSVLTALGVINPAQASLHALVRLHFQTLVGFVHLALGGLGLVEAMLPWSPPLDVRVVVTPDSTIAIMLFGLALLSGINGASRWLRGFATLLLSVCLYSLALPLIVSEGQTIISPLSGYPATGTGIASLFLLQALCLLLGNVPRLGAPLVMLLRTLLIIAGIVLLVAGWLPQVAIPDVFAHPFGHHQAGTVASLLVVASGAALPARPDNAPHGAALPGRPALIAAVAGALLSCGGWLLFTGKHMEAIAAKNELVLSQVQVATQTALRDHVSLLTRQAGRWQSLDQLPGDSLWAQESRSYLADFPALDSIALLQRDARPVRRETRHATTDAWLMRVLAKPETLEWLQGIEGRDDGNHGGHIGPLLMDHERHTVMLLGLPLRVGNGHWLVASLDLDTLFHYNVANNTDSFSVTISEGDQRLFSSLADEDQATSHLVGERTVAIGETHEWRVSSHIDAHSLKLTSVLPTLLLVSGLLFSFLLMTSLGLYRQGERRRQWLDASHRALSETVEQRNQFFTLSLDLFCRVDTDGRFLQTNPAFESVLGYPGPELVGGHYHQLVAEEDQPMIAEAIRRLAKGQRVQGMEVRVHDAHGRERWVEINAALGTEQVIYVVAHDITERKHTHQKLLRSEYLFRIAGETALIGGWYVDQDVGLPIWSDELCALHDEPPGFQPTLEQALDYYPPGSRGRIATLFNTCCQQGTAFDEELELVTAKGRRLWVRVVGKAIRDNQGRITQVQGSTQDITDQKRLSQEISRLGERLTSTLENLTDGFLMLDTQWRFTYVNREAGHILEQAPSRLLGRTLWEAFPQAQGTTFEAEYRRALDQGRSVTFEAHFAPLSLWVEVHAYPSPEGLAVYFRDINQRKAAERHLHILERSVNSTLNGVLIVDAQQRDLPIIYANSAFERITGYTREETLGRNCRFLQGENTDTKARQALRDGIAEQRNLHVVILNYRKDGSTFWNDLYISPVRDETGQVSHFIGIQNDISTQREYQAQLAYNASHDTLTELPNRALLSERLFLGCQLARRYRRHLAVLFIDLDGFKPINDTLGHDTGDHILIEVARRLEAQLRPGDTVARFGGDEFVLVLPDLAREEDVPPVVERLLTELSSPYWVEGNELHITASVGITLCDGHVARPMELIQQADMAMYKAKRQGRNTYQWFTPELNRKVSERVSLRNELQRAIEEQQFELYYQPQIHGSSGQVIGFEALIRWHHPQRGYISPATFIELAEDTGQIVPISDWVMDTACRDGKRLNALGLGRFTMAVNISPMQFQRPGFVDGVLKTLERSGHTAELLELELTEGILVDSAETAIRTLHTLREHGIGIAIDDFGTGYSSLSYLKYLPINKIKIDRGFIKDVVSDPRDAAIVQGISTMASQLQLQVVVEGVETQAQYAFLRNQRCETFQGYYFARPMPLDALERFLLEHHRQGHEI